MQKMLRHTDAQVTTECYAHLVSGYLQTQITRLKLTGFASPLLSAAANDGGPTEAPDRNDQRLSGGWIGAGNRIRTGDPQLGNARKEAGSLWQRMADVRKSGGWRARSERPFAHFGRVSHVRSPSRAP